MRHCTHSNRSAIYGALRLTTTGRHGVRSVLCRACLPSTRAAPLRSSTSAPNKFLTDKTFHGTWRAPGDDRVVSRHRSQLLSEKRREYRRWKMWMCGGGRRGASDEQAEQGEGTRWSKRDAPAQKEDLTSPWGNAEIARERRMRRPGVLARTRAKATQAALGEVR